MGVSGPWLITCVNSSQDTLPSLLISNASTRMANSCKINKGKKTEEFEWGTGSIFCENAEIWPPRGRGGGMVYVDKYPTFTDDGEHAAENHARVSSGEGFLGVRG